MNTCVLGAGAWGTAMALHLDRCGHAVTLVPRRMDHALDLASMRVNEAYLPGFTLPHRIQIGYEVAPLLMEAEVLFLACPSKAIRDLCESLSPHLKHAWQLKLALVMCKGLELDSFKTPVEILKESLPEIGAGVFSGPTYASEVARGQPTAVVMGVDGNLENAERYQTAFSNESLRVYLSNDVYGTELGGAMKNVYAIGAGLCDGLGVGDNAKAAYLTRSLNEMVHLGVTMGAQRETFYGLSGFGDLVATCSGEWSRNRTFGQLLGEGHSPQGVIENQRTVVEGYRATACFRQYCKEKGFDAPILNEIYEVLYQGRAPKSAMHALMTRDLKAE